MPYTVDVPDAQPGSGFDLPAARFDTEKQALFHAFCLAEHFEQRKDAPGVRLTDPSGMPRQVIISDLRALAHLGMF